MHRQAAGLLKPKRQGEDLREVPVPRPPLPTQGFLWSVLVVFQLLPRESVRGLPPPCPVSLGSPAREPITLRSAVLGCTGFFPNLWEVCVSLRGALSLSLASFLEFNLLDLSRGPVLPTFLRLQVLVHPGTSPLTPPTPPQSDSPQAHPRVAVFRFLSLALTAASPLARRLRRPPLAPTGRPTGLRSLPPICVDATLYQGQVVAPVRTPSPGL